MKDIIGGLLWVVEFFEVWCLKDYVIIVEVDGYIEFGWDYKNKWWISICLKDESLDLIEYLIFKGKYIVV